MESLKKIISTNYSKFEIKGTRVCEKCGSNVQVIRIQRNGQDEIVSDCLTCPTIEIEKEHIEYKQEIDENPQDVMYERFSLVPDDLKYASFETYIPNHPSQIEALKKTKYYADNFKNLDFTSLLLKGSYGVGKSHLGKSIADRVREKGHSAIFIDIPQLLRKIKNTFGTKESSDPIYIAIEKADLVVFDDLGAEFVKVDEKGESWASEVLFEMFSSRTGKAKIITTNCGSEELKNMYGKNGGRIVSRMMKGTKPIQVEGKDMRTEEF